MVRLGPLEALGGEFVISNASEELGEDDIGVLWKFVAFDIGLNYLDKFVPFVFGDSSFEGLYWKGIFLDAVYFYYFLLFFCCFDHFLKN